jgi:hypothetical protein
LPINAEKSFFLHYRNKLCNTSQLLTITETIQKETTVMSKRLFISSLAATFSFGAAVGLAIDELISNTSSDCPSSRNQTDRQFPPLNDWDAPATENSESGNQADNHSYRLNKPEAKTPDAPSDDLECRETSPGVSRCWPKDLAPAPDQKLTCIESGNETLCYPTPAAKSPKLDL